MIYFLYGQDTYRSRGKLRDIIAAFQVKTRDTLNITRVDAEEDEPSVRTIGRTNPLFGEKQLIIIERLFVASSDSQDFVESRIDAWVKDRTLTAVFWEGSIADSKSALFTALKRRAEKAQEFKVLGGAELGRWIDQAAKARGLALGVEERRVLADRFGGDLWATSSELEKMAAGWSLHAELHHQEKIWNFSDAFVTAPRKAFRALSELTAGGEEPIYLLAALGGALRVLALTWWGATHRLVKKATAGMHPYVAKKNLSFAREHSAASIRSTYDALITADVELKTGRLPSPLPLVKLILR